MRILVTNDDGIDAPGLRTLVKALADDGLKTWVAAPDSERSATGHGITILRPLTAVRAEVHGAVEAYAVDGRPADTTMLALSDAGLFADTDGAAFDLVVSGINRGNNYGLHVIYSGTVAGAREAACKGLPAVALSLDSHSRSADYRDSAAAALPLLHCLAGRKDLRDALSSTVLNVNVPACPLADMRGYRLNAQSVECTRPGFKPAQVDGMAPGARAWMNSAAAGTALDRLKDCDSTATNERFVSVSVLMLTSSAPLKHDAVHIDTSRLGDGIHAESALAVLELAAQAALASGSADITRRIAGGQRTDAPAESV